MFALVVVVPERDGERTVGELTPRNGDRRVGASDGGGRLA